ncbi:MAG: response regulator [Dehalococcoidia bacterium]
MSRVLVVDDDPQMRRLVGMVLEDEGHEVRLACNGLEALELLVGTEAGPEVIVLDLRMPELDGPGFLARYRAEWERCAPVVLMSGEDGEQVERLGATVVVTKPFDLDDLIAAVAAAIG